MLTTQDLHCSVSHDGYPVARKTTSNCPACSLRRSSILHSVTSCWWTRRPPSIMACDRANLQPIRCGTLLRCCPFAPTRWPNWLQNVIQAFGLDLHPSLPTFAGSGLHRYLSASTGHCGGMGHDGQGEDGPSPSTSLLIARGNVELESLSYSEKETPGDAEANAEHPVKLIAVSRALPDLLLSIENYPDAS